MFEDKSEVERIKEAYERRKKVVPTDIYSLFNVANLFTVQRREYEILNLFKKFKIFPLENKKILEVGCGTGSELRNLIRYRALPENMQGIDLLPDRIELAKTISPNIDFRCGDATNLPYESETFDIVTQFTVFTSILSSQMKRDITREALRVLKPDGIILWYDYHMDNPRNPDVKGVKKKEIYELFSNCDIYLKRITLAPPLTRAIAPYSYLVCYLLEKLQIFNTHYIGVIRKDYR